MSTATAGTNGPVGGADIVLIFAGFGIFGRSRWAVWVGIIAASLNPITQRFAIPAYPWWSLAVFGLRHARGLRTRGLRRPHGQPAARFVPCEG